MKKKLYETPRTQHVEIETEGNFCGSIVTNDPDNSGVTSGSQEVTGEFEFGSDDWN